jgi:hypothetical protein
LTYRTYALRPTKWKMRNRELNLEVQRMVHVIRDCSFLVLSLSKFID